MTILRYLMPAILLVFVSVACSPLGDDDDDDPTAPIVTPTPSSEDDDGDVGGGDPTSTDASTADTTSEATSEATSDATSEPGEATSSPAEPTPRFTPTPEIEFDDSGFAYGWNVGLRGDDQYAEHNGRVGEMVNESGTGWVRFQLEWFRMEPQPDQWVTDTADRMIDSMHEAGLSILVVVAKPPDWAVSDEQDTYLADMADVEDLMTYVADRYRGKVQAWEIWNEQNLAHEWGGQVNVDEYFEMLRASYNGVKAADPDALVVYGGLTPNGLNDPSVAIDDFNYLNLTYARSNGEIGQYFDVLGVHANSTHNSPDENWPEPITSGHEGWNDHPSFFFRRVEQLRQVMLDQGDGDKPVWITEFGWTTENMAPGYEYGVNNSEEEVAEFLTRALEISVDEWSWCTGAFIWNLNWSTLIEESDEKYPWSALNGDWSPRPQFDAVRDYLN